LYILYLALILSHVETLLQLVAFLLIGLDIGGTSVKAGILSVNGLILAQSTFPLPGRLHDDVVRTLILSVDTLLSKLNLSNDDILSVGICCPGIADIPAGIVRSASNFPTWVDVDIVSGVRDHTGKPTFLENDGNSAACGEWWNLTAHGAPIANLCLLTLGTGVGCGVVVDGHIVRGGGMAGEYGHAIIDYSDAAIPCGCGQRGCLVSSCQTLT
jgi:glucokinase